MGEKFSIGTKTPHKQTNKWHDIGVWLYTKIIAFFWWNNTNAIQYLQTCSIFIVIHDIFSDVVIIVVIGKHALIFVHSFPSHDYKSHHENDNQENYNRTRKDKLLPLVACKKKGKELILILQFCNIKWHPEYINIT